MQLATSLTRRGFLRAAALAGAAGILAACGPATAAPSGNYYLDHKPDILKDVKSILHFVQQSAAGRFGAAEAEALVAEGLAEYDRLLPGLPYIGGDDNTLTANLCQSAAALAFYRAMRAHGHDVARTGEVLYRATQNQLAATPMLGAAGRSALSETEQRRLQRVAERSHARQYPDDWVYDFVPGDGTTFTFGIDYRECGICKYLQAQGASELTPYLCLLDFPISAALNTGLVRTTTLARGDSRCDFRYRHGRPCRREWTPDFLKDEV